MCKSFCCAKDLPACCQSERRSGRPTDGEENVRVLVSDGWLHWSLISSSLVDMLSKKTDSGKGNGSSKLYGLSLETQWLGSNCAMRLSAQSPACQGQTMLRHEAEQS